MVDHPNLAAMEIMYGAFYDGNPNALFMLRNPSYLKGISPAMLAQFDNGEFKPELELLKRRIKSRFPMQTVEYSVTTAGENVKEGKVMLRGLEGTFSAAAESHFRARMSEQYPLATGEVSPLALEQKAHEMFVDALDALAWAGLYQRESPSLYF